MTPCSLSAAWKCKWLQIKYTQAEKTFEDEGKTEDEARKEYHDIAMRRVRLGIVLSQIGEDAKITVSEDELKQGLMAQSRQFPGQEQQLYDFYQKNPAALTELRAPIFEDKVVAYILELADVSENEISPEELMKPDEDDD